MYVIPEIEREGLTEHTLVLLQEYYKKPRIGTFGLTKRERSMILDHRSAAGCDLTAADCGSDLIAVSHFVIIVRSDPSTAEELSVLWSFCSEIEEAAKSVISIGDTGVPAALRSKVRIFPNFESLLPNLKYLLLDALRRDKKEEAFSKTLANAMRILYLIRARPGVTSRQLADELELSTRSVQRYIETLRVAGEWIDYDAKTRGWKLGYGGKSVLWDDCKLYEEDTQ